MADKLLLASSCYYYFQFSFLFAGYCQQILRLCPVVAHVDSHLFPQSPIAAQIKPLWKGKRRRRKKKKNPYSLKFFSFKQEAGSALDRRLLLRLKLTNLLRRKKERKSKVFSRCQLFQIANPVRDLFQLIVSKIKPVGMFRITQARNKNTNVVKCRSLPIQSGRAVK
jgi:hypothetical protein